VATLEPTPPPRMLGRYALYERIASGGMASVHIGRLVGPVGFARTVAIKRMHPHFAEDPEFVSMFLDEARLAARIRHPNVVSTLDVVAMKGELFLVMDYVQGESLAHLVRGATLRDECISPAIVATIMAGVLHGLHAAHEAKNDRGEPLEVVHRDVSPQNILVGVDGVSRVLDFGVAKAVGRLQTTRDGQLKGKLRYMAPEQLRGTTTRLTDVYAASVVLWEALTNRRAFQAENEAQMVELLVGGCHDPPSKYAAGVPSALDAVAMRGLSVDPRERFQTAREMACALEDALAPAAASKIGDWVERAAKDTLDERSAKIARIESDSLNMPAIPDSARPSSELPIKSGDPSDTVVVDEVDLTQLSSGSISASGRPAFRPRNRTIWLLAGGGLALLVGVLVAQRGWSGRAAATPSAASASALAPSPPAPPADAVSATLPASSPTTATTAATTGDTPRPPDTAAAPFPPNGTSPLEPAPRPPTTSGVPTAAPAPAPTTKPPPASAAKAPPVPAANCSPPYTLNAAGHRVRKPECH
jgi:serine/threonine protein kinase